MRASPLPGLHYVKVYGKGRALGTGEDVVWAGSVLAPVSAPGTGASLLRALLCSFIPVR